MFSSTQLKGPVYKNSHSFKIPGNTAQQKNNNMTDLLNSLQQEREIKDYIEDKIFVKLLKFEVIQPLTLNDDIVVITEYRETGNRDKYQNTKQINGAGDLAAELREALMQIFQVKANIVPEIRFDIIKKSSCGC